MLHSPPTNRKPKLRPELPGLGDRIAILILFLVPNPIFVGDAAARFADAIRFGTVSGHLLLSRRMPMGRNTMRASALLLLMFLCAGMSLVHGTSHSLRDLLDVLRIAAFWTVFLFGASLARKGLGSTDALMDFSKLMLAIGVLNAVFTIAQFYFPNVTRPLQLLYAIGDLRLLRMDLISEQGRAIGFFSNPNTNAVMLLLLGLPSVTLFQFSKRRLYLMLGAFVFATILLTASRTGLILLAIVIAVICIASRKFSYLFALAVISCGAYLALDALLQTDLIREWFPYLNELLVKVHGAIHGEYFDVASINSFSERLIIWERTLEWYHVSPLLGSGPLRDEIHSFADNYYVYLLSRYGIVGLTLYVLFSLYILKLSAFAAVSGTRPLKEWGIATLAALAVVNVANYTIDAFLTVPIGPLLLLYAGYMSSLSDTQRLTSIQRSWNPSAGRLRGPLSQARDFQRLAGGAASVRRVPPSTATPICYK